MLRRTSRRTGAPVGALIWVGAGSLLTMLLFIKMSLATRAVAISLAYGAHLIILAYILVVIAAIVFTIRRRVSLIRTAILLIGLAVLGYIAKGTIVPLPAPPYNWVVLAAGITVVIGIALPFVYKPLRSGIKNSPLLTKVRLRAQAWWTVGFEATGPASLLRNELEAAAAVVFADALPHGMEPDLDDSRSYAEWLGRQPGIETDARS